MTLSSAPSLNNGQDYTDASDISSLALTRLHLGTKGSDNCGIIQKRGVWHTMLHFLHLPLPVQFCAVLEQPWQLAYVVHFTPFGWCTTQTCWHKWRCRIHVFVFIETKSNSIGSCLANMKNWCREVLSISSTSHGGWTFRSERWICVDCQVFQCV